MMMMLMAMMTLFARIIMVIIRLAGADQNDPLSRTLMIMIILISMTLMVIILKFGRNNRALKGLSGGSKVVLNQ